MAVVRAPSRFGFAADAALLAEIDAAIARGARGVVFDLSDTMMLSSAGVRVIVQTAARPEMKGEKGASRGRVRAVAPNGQILEVLKLVRIDSMLPVDASVADAVAACRAAGA